jgi:hypothetical protein
LRERTTQTQQRIEADGIDPAVATVVRLAADSLSMEDLFGLTPIRDDRRQEVLAVIDALTRKDLA